MKTIIFILLCAAHAIAETPNETAKRVIESEVTPAYNPRDASVEELNRAAAINSQLQLRSILLGDSVSEELRLCFALRLIQERLGLRRVGQPLTPAEQKLVADQTALAARLRQLNEARE